MEHTDHKQCVKYISTLTDKAETRTPYREKQRKIQVMNMKFFEGKFVLRTNFNSLKKLLQ
jgi:hypothetical protein